jgi:hypothetical protein
MPDSAPVPCFRKVPVSGFSPFPGCYIFMLLAVFVTSILVWGGYTLYQQSRQIDAFTSPTRVPVPVRTPTPAESAALREKLTGFEKAVWAGDGPSLSLTVDELNCLFAGEAPFESVRELISFQKIDEHLEAQVSLPMNSLRPGDRRYLNGTISIVAATKPEWGFYAIADDIQGPGKTVSKDFIDNYRTGVIPGKSLGFLDDMLLGSFRKDRRFGPVLVKIQKVVLADGRLTVEASKGPAKPFKD